MNTYSSVDFNPFSGHEIQKICLTNESQKEIWLSCIIGGKAASLAYNQSVSLYFKGKLNLPALQQSIDDIILTHEAFRSNFSADGATLMIYENFPVKLSYQDISQLARSEQKDGVKEYIRGEMSTSFDLENGPLLRAGLLQLDAEKNVLILTTHHIITDGWSLNLMIKNLGDRYSLHCNNQSERTLEDPFQMSAYAKESLDFKESEAFLANETFWLQRYKDGVPETNIPTDFPRTPSRSYQGGHLEQSLSQELLPELKSLSVSSACSLFTLVLSAIEVFIGKTIHQNQLVMGIFSAGRPEDHHTQLVGHCVNLLPLKAVVDPKQGFKDYLKKRKSEILDAIDHQQFTFSELIKKLYIPRDAARVPLVPIVFNFDTGLGSDASFGELTVDCITNPREYENFELNISILWKNDSATLHFTYNKDLFKSETIRKMMNGFDFFLHEIIHKPSSSIEELRIEDPQASLDRITMRNDTHSPFSKDETLLSHVQNMVATYPKKTALRFHEEQLSFQELEQQSNQLAHLLLENGVQRGDNVGIALNRSPKVILSMLAVMKCGAVYIPLDPEFPHERIVYMLENSSAAVLITSSSFQGLFPSRAKELLIEDCWEKLNTYTVESPECRVSGNDLAYILYTSGSTGKPKGVQIRHYNLLNFLLSMQKAPGIKPTDKWLAITTVSFDIAGLEIFLPLISGAEIVLADESMTRNGAELLSIIRKQGITIMQATPATWTMMLYEDWEDKIPLKILCGGEAFPEALAQKLIVRSSEVWNMYGPTETTIWSTLKRLSLEDERITVGRPIDNTMVYILDENRQMVSEGSTGEIYIAGDGLALGYMNRPELSLEKFIDNPFEPERSPKMYGTGDLGIALENGEVQCLGRLDHQVKIRGYRIELGEIEHVLNQNDSVKEAIVVAREDTPNDKRLCAYVIPSLAVDETNAGVLKMIWKQKLKEKLPPYMIPSDFVLITRFPLTPNGKIDRKQLSKQGGPILHKEKEQVVRPHPTAHVQKSHSSFTGPSTPMESLVADIWSEYLCMPIADIRSDFFELGGHSMIAINVMIAIEKKTRKKLPLSTLFENSTVESLARVIVNGKSKPQWESLVPIKTGGSKIPIYLIHGWGLNILIFKTLSKFLEVDQPVYGIQAQGLGGQKINSLDSVEKLASYFNAELLRNDPNGPYILGGYSFGGIIAFEMAKQLMAIGKEIRMLGILDTYAASGYSVENKSTYFLKKGLRQFSKLKFVLKSFINCPKETLAYQRYILAAKFKANRNNDNPEDNLDHSIEKEILKNYSQAYNTYQLAPLAINIDLFRVKKRLYYLDDPKYLAWDKYADQGVTIHDIPGDHKTFLFSPNVEQLAEIIQEALNARNLK